MFPSAYFPKVYFPGAYFPLDDDYVVVIEPSVIESFGVYEPVLDSLATEGL
jgi:hypothetical protein